MKEFAATLRKVLFCQTNGRRVLWENIYKKDTEKQDEKFLWLVWAACCFCCNTLLRLQYEGCGENRRVLLVWKYHAGLWSKGIYGGTREASWVMRVRVH